MNDKGVSVQEMENFARKHLTEIFLILSVVIATISSMLDFFTGPTLGLGFAGLGAILSIAYPQKILSIQKSILQFLGKQETSVQVIIGITRFILAIFVPFILFLEIGMLAGLGFHILPKISKDIVKMPFKESAGKDEEHP